jgi:CheY-like chemotaxis protein
MAQLRVICEVEDGLEAIQKAGQIQPDLVLLDIGLPTLNGIEAARQIRVVSPTSKILFVSQERSPDVVQAALETGARGYVCKIDTGSGLTKALEVILQGRTYLSRSVAQGDFAEAFSPGIQIDERKLILTPPPHHNEKSWHHEVGFYADERSLWQARFEFVSAALKNGNAAVLIASETHQNRFLSRLQADGVNVRATIEQGRYLTQDVAEALSSLMVDDLPDPVNFSKLASGLIAKGAMSVGGDTSRVFVCGEATTLLWEQGNAGAVLRLENLWDEMTRTCTVRVHCGYVSSTFRGETGRHVYERICAEHSAVLR